MKAVVFCWALLAGLLGLQPAKAAPPQQTASTALDFQFFKTKVQPIFLFKRPGHARCVACHAGPTSQILHLEQLSPGSKTWNDEQSRKNFEAVKFVVAPGNVKSPLLLHPLAEDAGGDFFHGGGKHFNSQTDPEWLTLKAFVMGQKATSGN